MYVLLHKHVFRLASVALIVWLSATVIPAQTPSFTYQGRLTDGGNAASGNYDLQFALFDAVSGGAQIGATQTLTGVVVSAGTFTVQLNFGANAFPGANRFLEIGARTPGAASFTTLAPRQPITSTPYAIRSLNASSADAVAVAGVPGGSGNYIQNTTVSQAATNFNISGNGTAAGTLSGNVVNATTQFNLGGSRILSAPGEGNLFAGVGAGTTTTGRSNAFFGVSAGLSNTTGLNNTFLGASAGPFNETGNENVFIGINSGISNISGRNNTLVGTAAGEGNEIGGYNTSVGSGTTFGSPGLTNATAVGAYAQVNQSNSIVLGSIAGLGPAPASVNVGIGTPAPRSRLHVVGSSWFQGDNTPLPASAGKGIVVGFGGEQGYISAFDYGTFTAKNLLLNNSGGNVGIGTAAPQAPLHVNGAGILTLGGNREVSLGTPNGETGIGIKGTTNRADVRFDGTTLKLVAGPGTGPPLNTSGLAVNTLGNVGIGTTSPAHRLSVIGGPAWTSNAWSGSMEFSNASAMGWQVNAAGWHFGIGQTTGGLYIFQTSSELGSTASPVTYDLVITDGGNVGIGTISPDRKLSVNGGASKAGGGSWEVFSDERLKTIKGRFTLGLDAVMKLQPLRYEYKRDNALGIDSPGEHIGFGAQAVQKVIPEAVSKNDQGYLLINNDPILLSMLNAIKEQQQQIETLRIANTALSERLRTVEKGLAKRRGGSRGRRR
jgi:endosialidase-like protein